MKEKWLDDLRDNLSDFETDVPEGLWDSLGVDTHVPTRRAWLRKWSAAAAVIVLLIIGTSIIFWLGHSSERLDTYLTKDTPVYSHSGEPIGAGTAPSGTIRNHAEKLTIAKRSGKYSTSTSVAECVDADMEEIVAQTEVSVPDSSASESVSGIKKDPEHTSSRIQNPYAGVRPKRKSGGNAGQRFAMSMSASGFGNSLMSEGNGFQDPPVNGTPIGPPDHDQSNNGSDSNSPLPDIPDPTPAIVEMHHYQPVRFGLTLQYNVNRRIGLETGLIYTALGTDISVSDDNRTATGHRKLHYLGIPLNVKVSALSWKCLDLYLSAGTTAEKCIGNRFTLRSRSDMPESEEISGHNEKPFQWSVNAAAGLQINPWQNIGIFAEPGISYYFDDGTSLPTLYKDHPCRFNLSIGIRFILN